MKEYIINEYSINKDKYIKYVNWYNAWCNDGNSIPNEKFRSRNKEEVIEEFKSLYEYDVDYINSVYHYELESIDNEEENFETLESSKLCSSIFSNNIYKKVENDLIFKSYFSDNKNDEKLAEIIIDNIDYDLHDIKEELIEEVIEDLKKDDNKDFILTHISYKLYDYISEKSIYTTEDIEEIEREAMIESSILKSIQDNRYNILNNTKDSLNIYYSVGYEGFEQIVMSARITNIEELKGKSIEYIEKNIKFNIVDINYEIR